MVSLQEEETEDRGMHIGKAVKTQGGGGPLQAKEAQKKPMLLTP